MSDQNATSSVTPGNVSPVEEGPAAPNSDIPAASRPHLPRWLIVAAWAFGPAGLYGLVSLAHAAMVEGNLTVDIGFGRSLAIWIGAMYLALLLWGFLPARPNGWYARRTSVLATGLVGLIGVVVGGVYTALWLRTHWVPTVGGPVVGSIVVLMVAATFTLWLAGRADGARGETRPPST